MKTTRLDAAPKLPKDTQLLTLLTKGRPLWEVVARMKVLARKVQR